MKCYWCKRDINRGTEAQKMVTFYKTPSGEEVRVCTYDGVPKPPPGSQILRAAHYKCDKLHAKRLLRGGDAVTGRGIGAIPTAYDITKLTMNQDDLKALGLSDEEAASMNTRELSERVQKMRKEALDSGTGMESWEAKARFREKREKEDAEVKKRVDGIIDGMRARAMVVRDGMREKLEAEVRAQLALERTQADRAQDPGYEEPKETDWRDQTVMEVADVPTAESPGELVGE